MSTADFIERRTLSGWAFPEAALLDARDALFARGATFLRASITPVTKVLIVEGWLTQPDDQGDLPL